MPLSAMLTSAFSKDTERFVAELDIAIEAHMEWSRRVLRCAVLRVDPGSDVLAADAHRRCRFGRWFEQSRDVFEQLDAATTARVVVEHERMHDAVRHLCTELLASGTGRASDLDTFERTQSALLAGLAQIKTELLAQSARHDALTGLPLRYGLDDEFRRCRAVAQRHGEELVLVMVDVDHFKLVNDAHGHTTGDQALRHIASILRSQVRAGEPLVRFGGEEFLALLQSANLEAANRVAERLLQAVRDKPMPLPDGQCLDLRVSAGIAMVGASEGLPEAIERADRALYAAKAAGRDRLAWAPA